MARGLKPFGLDAVEAMNGLEILIDVSHLSDGGFWDVAKRSKKPFVASHSNARALSPHPRNLTDDMIRALADAGGVMGLNFAPKFLSVDAAGTKSSIEQLCRLIEHVRRAGGIDCIAVGSDFDGIRGELEVADASRMPALFEGLRRRGFADGEIEKIAFQNARRVIGEAMR